MKLQIIGVKELHKQLRQVSKAALQGQSFLVVRNSKPVFRIEPVEHIAERKYSLKDFEKLQFSMRDKDENLSKKIDEILYEI